MRVAKSMVVFLVLASIAMFPSAARAKGVQRATISGPDLDSPITFRLSDSLDGVDALASETGLYPALFETQPNPIVQTQPVDDLGPRYDAEYVTKIPGRKALVVHQDLYPYAQPDPVTYTAPGQPRFDRGASIGGWYVAGPALLPLLVSKGLPEMALESEADEAAAAEARPEAPPSEPSSPTPWMLLVGAGLAALVVTGVVVRKIGHGDFRRPVRAER